MKQITDYATNKGILGEDERRLLKFTWSQLGQNGECLL